MNKNDSNKIHYLYFDNLQIYQSSHPPEIPLVTPDVILNSIKTRAEINELGLNGKNQVHPHRDF